LDVIRAGGMTALFDGVDAAATLGILLREFTFGRAQQLASAARAHLVALAARTPMLAGADARVFIDIDSLLRPVYGYAKQGASFGHTKVSGKQVLRTGLSPLATTISAPIAATGAGRDPTARGAGRLRQSRGQHGHRGDQHCRSAGGTGDVLVRGSRWC
jgi:hypothetical protein